MNLLHLKYFFIVAREGSFSKASQLLKIDQSALSRMVKQLEQALNATLLERQPRGVGLTDAGKSVFAQASEIFNRVEALERDTGKLKGACEGDLTIGTTDLIAIKLCAAPLKRLLKDSPLIYPTLHIGSATDSIPHLANGRLEFGFFYHLPPLPTSLAVTRRWPQRFHLVCSTAESKNPFVLKNFIGSREVDDRLNRRFPTLMRWKKEFPDASIGASSNSLLFQQELVKGGVGIAVLPKFLVEKDIGRGKLTDLLPKERLEFDMKMVQRKNIGLSRNAVEFLKYFGQR